MVTTVAANLGPRAVYLSCGYRRREIRVSEELLREVVTESGVRIAMSMCIYAY